MEYPKLRSGNGCPMQIPVACEETDAMRNVYVLEGPDAGRCFELQNPPLSVGRFPDNHIVLRDDFLSRKNVVIGKTDEGFFMQDLGSVRLEGNAHTKDRGNLVNSLLAPCGDPGEGR